VTGDTSTTSTLIEVTQALARTMAGATDTITNRRTGKVTTEVMKETTISRPSKGATTTLEGATTLT